MANKRKIVFIGAGSIGFTRGLFSDIMTHERLTDADVYLVDIHKERLEMARRSCQKIIDAGGYKSTLHCTMNRREALKGADAVMTTILCGDVNVWQHDILIPKKYGIDINVGDTRGPSGIFRFLRTAPEMLAICKDIDELCPGAIYLNYTNPMAMLCQAMQKSYPDLAISGLCHSVQGTSAMLANWIGVKPEDVDYVCAGINHMAYYLKFEKDGKDLYPKIRKAITTKKSVYEAELVRNEMYLAMGYYITESSGHNSEYNWWFRKRKDLIKTYCKTTKNSNWNPGEYGYILKMYKERKRSWKKGFTDWINSPDWNDQAKCTERLKCGGEYASHIINAWCGGEPFKFNGNVPNTGLVTNLLPDACVEVPVLVSRNRLEPIGVGDLPIACVPLTSLSATCEVMAVQGSLTGDPELIYQAIANDPLTASVLSLREIRKMVKEMFAKNKNHLPQFKKINL
ncbi:MAG: alpha-glucosidase/alpha-galactosidase [Verrucomicrobia bacterium]|nr:alpha-glucosidase/alpha-galactosidase [Verrucomicrobiota bacterium]